MKFGRPGFLSKMNFDNICIPSSSTVDADAKDYYDDDENIQFIPAYACCELVPVNCELIPRAEDYDDCCHVDDKYSYPAASASYTSCDNAQAEHYVNLDYIDQDFLDIYDMLAREDGSYELGPSPVAMPIVYAVPEELVSSSAPDVAGQPIQLATPVDVVPDPAFMKPKILRTDFDPEKKVETTNNRERAINRWLQKRQASLNKSSNPKCMAFSTARKLATAVRARELHGKFKRVKSKWVVASKYFGSTNKEPSLDDDTTLPTTTEEKLSTIDYYEYN